MAPQRRKPIRSKLKTAKKSFFRLGPITKNPFLNFLRSFRLRYKSANIIEQTKRAAMKWQRMTTRQKMPYIRMAEIMRNLRPKAKPCPDVSNSSSDSSCSCISCAGTYKPAVSSSCGTNETSDCYQATCCRNRKNINRKTKSKRFFALDFRRKALARLLANRKRYRKKAAQRKSNPRYDTANTTNTSYCSVCLCSRSPSRHQQKPCASSSSLPSLLPAQKHKRKIFSKPKYQSVHKLPSARLVAKLPVSNRHLMRTASIWRVSPVQRNTQSTEAMQHRASARERTADSVTMLPQASTQLMPPADSELAQPEQPLEADTSGNETSMAVASNELISTGTQNAVLAPQTAAMPDSPMHCAGSRNRNLADTYSTDYSTDSSSSALYLMAFNDSLPSVTSVRRTRRSTNHSFYERSFNEHDE